MKTENMYLYFVIVDFYIILSKITFALSLNTDSHAQADTFIWVRNLMPRFNNI